LDRVSRFNVYHFRYRFSRLVDDVLVKSLLEEVKKLLREKDHIERNKILRMWLPSFKQIEKNAAQARKRLKEDNY